MDTITTAGMHTATTVVTVIADRPGFSGGSLFLDGNRNVLARCGDTAEGLIAPRPLTMRSSTGDVLPGSDPHM
jgi:hypothetical protein